MPHTKKALLVIENAGAGTGRHVLDLSEGLLGLGWEVHLAYSESRLEASFAAAIHSMPQLRRIIVPMRRQPGPWDLTPLRQLHGYIKQAAADGAPFRIIHGHSSKGGALARLAGIGSGAQVFYTPHAFVTLDPSLSRLKRFLFTRLERILSVLGDGVLCVSTAEGRHAVDLGIPAAKVFVVPNGIRPLPAGERERLRRELQIPSDFFCLGFVGRIASQKSVDQLIHCFSAVRRQHAKVKLLVVGDGPDREAFTALGCQLGIDDDIIWFGQGDGQELMAAMDGFVMASAYEGFPYVLLEAAARNLPIFMTEVGGAEEFAAHAAAKVVPVGAMDQLAERLVTALANPQQLAHMAEQSAAAAFFYSVDRMVVEVEKVYLAQGPAVANPG